MSRYGQITSESFLKDVKQHKLTILKDDGLYRHIYCSKGSYDQHFEIVTFPGHLVYTGDMGTYVFSRVDDMFTFFRSKKKDGNPDYEINPDYWSEKVLAESVFGEGIEKFEVDRFQRNVIRYVIERFDLESKEDIPEDILEEIEPLMSAEDEWECVEKMRNFRSEKVEFHDFWEYSNKEFTYHYLWACYAIVWATSQYDLIKEKENK